MDDFGDRMKLYENCTRNFLPRRLPILIRVDGQSFHTVTKGCKKPYDEKLIWAIDETAKFLCEETDTCVFSYQQSDEISLLLINYYNNKTQPWFANNLNKIVSTTAAKASAKFTSLSKEVFGKEKIVTFDSRAWVLPHNEVVNYFWWRQVDWHRNSIQMLARSLYSHRECENKNISQLQEMTFQKGKDWNNLKTHLKRGRSCVKVAETGTALDQKLNQEVIVERSKWIVNHEIPIFSKDRDFIEKLVSPKENKS